MEYFIWNIDPNIISFGVLKVRWYGILFVGSFFIGLYVMKLIYKREAKNPDVLDDFLIYVFAGAVIGARLMHCFAYEPHYYLNNPLEILMIWKGGLASHGGMLGVIIAIYILSIRFKESLIWLLSRAAIVGMIPAIFVRLGNFFNSEILGKPTDVSWAVIFQRVDMLPRHPVQLYEALSYFTLFIILTLIYLKVDLKRVNHYLISVFLIGVFGARFILEFFKTKQASYSWDLPFTTGQMLSLPLIILGVIWFIYALLRKN